MKIDLIDFRPHDERVEVLLRMPDGELRGHVFPRDTLEWRAAEYDIPLDDLDTLLDVVLTEPHLDDMPFHTDQHHPHFLYNAPDVETAREHHLARCGAVEVVPESAELWERVKGHCLVHPEAHRLKVKMVAHTRAETVPAFARRAAARPPEDPHAARIERLRALVEPPERAGLEEV